MFFWTIYHGHIQTWRTGDKRQCFMCSTKKENQHTFRTVLLTQKKSDLAEGNLSRTQARVWEFFPPLAQLYLSFGRWVPLTPLSNNSSLRRETQLKQLSLTLRAGLSKDSTWKCWETRMFQKHLFINSSPAPGQLSPEDCMVPIGGGGTKLGLPVETSPFMLLLQYDLIAPRERFYIFILP